MSGVEEQRAADYRAEQVTRAEATASRIAGLAGSVSARVALATAWAPVQLVAGALLPVAPGMYVDSADLQDPDTGYYEPGMPFTDQIA